MGRDGGSDQISWLIQEKNTLISASITFQRSSLHILPQSCTHTYIKLEIYAADDQLIRSEKIIIIYQLIGEKIIALSDHDIYHNINQGKKYTHRTFKWILSFSYIKFINMQNQRFEQFRIWKVKFSSIYIYYNTKLIKKINHLLK